MNEVTPHLEFLYVLVCDDIRREDNGKEIIIGVYSSGILVRSFPADLSLAFSIQFRADKTGDVRLEARVLGPRGTPLIGMQLGVSIQQPSLGSLVVPAIPVQIKETGNILVQMKQDVEDWETVTTIGVTILDPTQIRAIQEALSLKVYDAADLG